jgi:hypothetical protein
MEKLPKYTIIESSGKLILNHNRFPRFIGEIQVFKSLPDFEKYQLNPPKDHFCTIDGQCVFIGTRTELNGTIITMHVTEFLDIPAKRDLPLNGDIRGGLMARTGDWLYSYFKDNQEFIKKYQ